MLTRKSSRTPALPRLLANEKARVSGDLTRRHLIACLLGGAAFGASAIWRSRGGAQAAGTLQTAAAGSTIEVELAIDPQMIAQAQVRLATAGLQLGYSDEGLVEVPLQMPEWAQAQEPYGRAKARAQVAAVEMIPQADGAISRTPDRTPQRADALPERRTMKLALKPGAEGRMAALQQIMPASGPASGIGRIAIVIDDMGLSVARAAQAAALPGPLTLAYLPYADGLPAQTRAARERGHELLVHLPMQPSNATVNPGPQAMLAGLSQPELDQRLAWNLSRFSGFVGVNNHMGSAYTGSAELMRPVLSQLSERGLFFLDSRTTPHSAARDVSVELGLPYAERDVFLDNHRSAEYVGLQLAQTEELARRYGSAVAIGHPHAETLDMLARWLPTLKARGFELVPVSDIVKLRASPLWRLARQGQPTSHQG